MTLCADTISIRSATPEDADALARLAALDSARVPAGPILLAERQGELRAALAMCGGATIADPFVETNELVALLRLRAQRLTPRSRWSARLRRTILSRRAHRAFAA